MAEKFRRVKREYPYFVKRFSAKPFVVAGSVFFMAAAAGLAGWFYFDDARTNENGPSQIKPVNQTLVAVICRKDNCFWLNEDGISFNQGGRTEGNIVLNLEDKTDRGLKVGDNLLAANILAELSFLRQRMQEDFDLNLKTGETNDANLNDFDFTTSEGWLLRFSVAENIYKTLETLKRTLEEIKKTAPSSGLEYIDLRVPNKVYYKFK